MFISVNQSFILDNAIKAFEVAFRSFIVDNLTQDYASKEALLDALSRINTSSEVMYAGKIRAKVNKLSGNIDNVYNHIVECNQSYINMNYDNDVPYVSELIDFILIFFNSNFSTSHLTDGFSSIEDFHFSASLYYAVRNDLSHPASRPISEVNANKVIYFIDNLIVTLDNKYFWYESKTNIQEKIKEFYNVADTTSLKVSNLDSVRFLHKKLLCRDTEINTLSVALLGDETRKRLAGSVSLYGYGGVGKTAMSIDFLYRVMREKKDGKHNDIEYLLFFSSKDECLTHQNTTGNFYIDKIRPEFTSLSELQQSICKTLSIDDINDLITKYKRGIIVIDNIENLPADEKSKIFTFIKSLPPEVQFIITSRNEEQGDERIHLEEFRNKDIGIKFIIEYLNQENLFLDLNNDDYEKLILSSKGNALILIQLLNILANKTHAIDSLVNSVNSIKAKNAETIADFMYKNTFNESIQVISDKGYSAEKIIQIISLYDEPIELYSISRLAKIDVSLAEEIIDYLTQQLILVKQGEYYSLNEFAERFVFIKMLPDRIELGKLQDAIRQHKLRIKKTLDELDERTKTNEKTQGIMDDWQPQNYIDRITIAEVFTLFSKAKKCIDSSNREAYDNVALELQEQILISDHPYIPFQQARILRLGYDKFYREDTDLLQKIEHLYESAIEAIEYNHRYLMENNSYPSILMLFGIFLNEEKKASSRAIRFLEKAIIIFKKNGNSGNFFMSANYLLKAYKNMHNETNDRAYSHSFDKLLKESLAMRKIHPKLRINNYIKRLMDKKND
jgi:hypothetical protein